MSSCMCRMASRAVGVMGNLVSVDLREGYADENRQEQERAGEKHQSRKAQPLLSWRTRGQEPAYDWSAYTPPRHHFWAVAFKSVPLSQIVPYIDWTPFFFHAWKLRGIYPKIFEQEGVGPRRKVDSTTGELLDQIVREVCSERAP